MASEERLRELEEKYEDYTVYDNQGSKIGKVDDLFVDEKDHEEYIGVKLGFLGRKSTLIPTEIVRVNEGEKTIEVSESKDHVKDAPSFDDDEDVTAEYEERIRRHFGLESLESGSGGSYGAAAGSSASVAGAGASDSDEDRESGSSGYAPGGDRGSSSETSSGERETSSGTGYYEQTGGSGGAEERRETSGTSGTTGGAGQSSQPATTRETEETETYQEGGRTKIRRRVIREEVVDADDQGSSS
ncbi:MAG TPA: PRC-barrel domain-containing protein [Rubrobacter sp.]|nr:PRC-barrel domain-containing protein [Rubrobacter sp.]